MITFINKSLFFENIKKLSNHISPAEIAFIYAPEMLPDNIERSDAEALLFAHSNRANHLALLSAKGGDDANKN